MPARATRWPRTAGSTVSDRTPAFPAIRASGLARSSPAVFPRSENRRLRAGRPNPHRTAARTPFWRPLLTWRLMPKTPPPLARWRRIGILWPMGFDFLLPHFSADQRKPSQPRKSRPKAALYPHKPRGAAQRSFFEPRLNPVCWVFSSRFRFYSECSLTTGAPIWKRQLFIPFLLTF